jgi:hypothetical protein
MKWRVGPIPASISSRYGGMGQRAIYRCVNADGSTSDSDIFIGIMNSEESASLMVGRLNGEIECRCACHARESREAG